MIDAYPLAKAMTVISISYKFRRWQMTIADDMAFPCEGPNTTAYGLTKREFFAGLALQGLSAGMHAAASGADLINCEAVALDAIALADALIKELAVPDTIDDPSNSEEVKP